MGNPSVVLKVERMVAVRTRWDRLAGEFGPLVRAVGTDAGSASDEDSVGGGSRAVEGGGGAAGGRSGWCRATSGSKWWSHIWADG